MTQRGKAETFGLWYLFFNFLVPGAWALFFPGGFYENFPLPGHPWVAADGPFNEHLLRDFGGLHLSLAALVLFHLLRPQHVSSTVVAVSSLFFGVPHLYYHVTHIHRLDRLEDQIGTLVLLGLQVLIPLLVLAHPEKRGVQV